MKDGVTGDLYEISVLPATCRELVDAIYKQKDLSRSEAREMADYLDEKFNISPYVPVKEKK